MNITNLTGKEIILFNLEHEGVVSILKLKPDKGIATATKRSVYLGDIQMNGIGVAEKEIFYTDLQGLPKPKENQIYLVSEQVARSAPERRDLRVPSNPLFDENGTLIGYQSVSRIY